MSQPSVGSVNWNFNFNTPIDNYTNWIQITNSDANPTIINTCNTTTTCMLLLSIVYSSLTNRFLSCKLNIWSASNIFNTGLQVNFLTEGCTNNNNVYTWYKSYGSNNSTSGQLTYINLISSVNTGGTITIIVKGKA